MLPSTTGSAPARATRLPGRRVAARAGRGVASLLVGVLALTAAATLNPAAAAVPAATTTAVTAAGSTGSTGSTGPDLSGYTPVPRFVRLDTGTTLPDFTLIHGLERLPGGSVRLSTSRDLQVLRTDQLTPVAPTVAATDRASHAAAGLGWSANEVRTAWWNAQVDDTGTRYAFVCKSDLRIGYGGGWRPLDDCFLRTRAETATTWSTILGGGSTWLDERKPYPNQWPVTTPQRRSAEEADDLRLTAPLSVALDRQRDILYFTEGFDGWRWTWAFDLDARTLVRVGADGPTLAPQAMTGLSVRADGTLLAVKDDGYAWVVDPVSGDGLRQLGLAQRDYSAWLSDNGDGTMWAANSYSDLERSKVDPDSTAATTFVPLKEILEAVGNVRYGPVIDDPAGAIVAFNPYSAVSSFSGWGVYRMEPGPRVPGPSPDVSVTTADRSLTVEWNPADGYGFPITGYRVTLTPGGKTATVPPDGSRRLFFDGLTNGTSYRVDVRALSLVGDGTAASKSVVPRDGVAPPRVSVPAPTLRSVFTSPTGAVQVANSAVLTWTPPTRTAVPDYAGVTIVRKQCACTPSSPTDGTVVHRGTATEAAAFTVAGLAPGKPYTLAVFARDTSGNHSPASVRTVRGTSAATAVNVTATTTQRIAFGATTAVQHRVRVRDDRGVGVARATTTLQVRYRTTSGGWSAWSSITSKATDTYGSALFTHRPTRNAQYRALSGASSVHTGTVGSAASLVVTKAVTSSVSATSVRRGTTVTVSGSVKPAHPYSAVTLQRKTSTGWSTVATGKLTSTSSYRFSVRQTGPTTLTYRVVAAADADHATGVSSSRTVRWT